MCFFWFFNKTQANEINGIQIHQLQILAHDFLELEEVLCNVEGFKYDGAILLKNLHYCYNKKNTLEKKGLIYLPININKLKQLRFMVLGSHTKIFIFCFDFPSLQIGPHFKPLFYSEGSAIEDICDIARNQFKFLIECFGDYIPLLSASSDSPSQSIDDLDITILGYKKGGACAQILGLFLANTHPLLLEKKQLKVITFGTISCFDHQGAEEYNIRLNKRSIHYVYKSSSHDDMQNTIPSATIIEGPEPLWTKDTLKSYKESVDLLTMDNFSLVINEDTFLDKGRIETQ